MTDRFSAATPLADTAAALAGTCIGMFFAGMPADMMAKVSPSVVWMIGGAIVFVAAAARAVYQWVTGRSIDLHEPLGLVLGALGTILGAAGVPEALPLDTGSQAALGSQLAALVAATRALRSQAPR